MGFNPSFERPTCLATLKSCDTMKQSVCGWQYIYIYIYILGNFTSFDDKMQGFLQINLEIIMRDLGLE